MSCFYKFFIHSFEPAANGIPSSVFFPQSDPEERLSQCSASLQALLALSATSLHALSKLVINPEIAEDIISVMRNVVAQFPTKCTTDTETSVDIPLSVRLWRVSGCHELLASLGFDLMEVGQDQVTLRTGKQANRRNCQFVLQALLALFGMLNFLRILFITQLIFSFFLFFSTDTQEAPKSLGLDSSSSTESLNEDSRQDQQNVASSSTNSQQRSISPVGTVKSLNLNMPRPPLPFRRAPILSTGGAFTSYVRRRGEPDGGRTDTESVGATSNNAQTSAQITSTNAMDTLCLNNTTDSELSDGYTSHTLNKFEPKPKMGYSSLRGPVKVGRPGGGGESDAAFTPSPPVAADPNVSLALAHQTRIRNLYSSATGAAMPGDNLMRDGHQMMMMHSARRPDSSSSASSTTDWESSGHATVLRRAHQSQQAHHPPLPPPRQTLPLVDSLRPLAPLAPVYNNLGLTKKSMDVAGIESTSSDSEFERGFDLPSVHLGPIRGRSKLKPLQQFLSRKISDQIDFIDKLSVRTEITATATIDSTVGGPSTTSGNTGNHSRKPINLPEDETNLAFSANNLYFSPSDPDAGESELSSTVGVNKKELLKNSDGTRLGVSSSSNSSGTTIGTAANANNNTNNNNSTPTKDHYHHHKLGAHSKNIQESILRHMNREMTPTISDVYHERNLGLGLAPPLSKLLLSKNYEENDTKNNGNGNISVKVANLTEIVSEIEINAATTNSNPIVAAAAASINSSANTVGSMDRLDRCGCDCNETELLCACKSVTMTASAAATMKKSAASLVASSSTKPWLSNVVPNIIKASDLTTADILERQHKVKAAAAAAVAAATVANSNNSCSSGSDSATTSLISVIKRSSSPFSDLSRRDDGDGRSVADSQCSGSYKIDPNTIQKQIRNKFNL